MTDSTDTVSKIRSHIILRSSCCGRWISVFFLRLLCGSSNNADPVFRLQAGRHAVFYLDYLTLQGKTLATLHPHYLVLAASSMVTHGHFPMTQLWAIAPDVEEQDGSWNVFVCLSVCVSVAQTRAAACAHSTSTSGVTSTGSGSMSPKVTKPTSVPATVLTSGVPTTTTTWWVGIYI